MVRRATATRIGRSPVIMALPAEIDVRIVLVSEGYRRADGIIVGGGKRVPDLSRKAIRLMRVVAHHAHYSYVSVPVGQRSAIQQTYAHGPGMAPAATVDVIRCIEILDYAGVYAAMPLIERGIL